MGQLLEMCLAWRELAGERDENDLAPPKTRHLFENEKKLYERQAIQVQYLKSYKELHKDICY